MDRCCRNKVAARAAGILLALRVVLPGAEACAQEIDMNMTLDSAAFVADGEIPARYTCEGADVSPPLAWDGIPGDARSLVLILDDPDAPDPAAPRMTWVHWVLYDIPPDAAGLAEDAARSGLPAGTREGVNDWQRTGYGGPCPPIGRHRYFHKLYALDVVLGDLNEPTKAQLEAAMDGHVLASAQLIGTYRKKP
jgi:Raf kinase inhibitor-like YbhB/YbcL family protein